jgi:hypothetical protein
MFHQNLRGNLLTGFLSQVLESVVFLTWVDLFLQRKDYAGKLMGSHGDSRQALLFQLVNFVGRSCYMREFEWGGLFTPSSLELGESAYKRREARFMVLTIKPGPMPSPQRSLQRKVEEASTRASLETYTPNHLLVGGAQLVFQEKIVLEQGKIGGNSKKCFTEMDEDGDLKNEIRIEMD